MSIINEALKKAQETNKQQVNAADQAPAPSAPAPANTQDSQSPAVPRQNLKRSAKGRRFLPVLAALIIISGILVFSKSFFRKISPAANLLLAPANIAKITPPAAEPAREAIQQAATPVPASKNAPDLPNLKLSGIVYDNERSYAIVNDKVLLKGDMVDGATLIEINRESVKFVFNDKEFELSSK